MSWHIQYYFYPANSGKRKLVVVKGMNGIKDLADRRDVTQVIIQDEIENNKKGYNPIEKIYVVSEIESDTELHPNLHFIDAYRIALSKLNCTDQHRKETGWAINRIDRKVSKLKLNHVTIELLKRSELKRLLESCKLPDYYFNKILGYISVLYGELIEYECCELNLTRDIRKRKFVKKQREILSPDHHGAVMSYLRLNYYEFWRYAQIFLYSGGRTTELFQLKVKDVCIDDQEFKVTIRKGSRNRKLWSRVQDFL